MSIVSVTECVFTVPAGATDFNVKTAVTSAVDHTGAQVAAGTTSPAGSPFPDNNTFNKILMVSTRDIFFRRNLLTRSKMPAFSNAYVAMDGESLSNLFLDSDSPSDATVYLWLEVSRNG